MNKRIYATICAILLFLCTAMNITAFATQEQTSSTQPTYVLDAAEILTQEEIDALNLKAQNITQEHGVNVYVVTVYDYTQWYNTSDIYYAATQFYEDYDLGYGEDKEGVLLMLSMYERDFAYIIYGPKTHSVFDNDTMIDIENDFLFEFSFDDWYLGFEKYYEGTDFNLKYPWMPDMFGVLISSGVGIIIALFVVNHHKGKLSNIDKKRAAHEYVPNGGVRLDVKNDVYTHTTTSRVRIHSSSSGGGGGGSRSHSGGGFSGRSGKF